MNHKEALMQLSLDELKQILDKLNITPFEGAVRSWIAGKISDFYEDLNKFRSVISQVGEKTVNDLLLYVHTKKPLSDSQLRRLNEVGMVVNNELPNDFSNRLREWSRKKYVKTFPFKLEEVHHSFFLKCVLALFYLRKEREIKLTNRNNDKNVRVFSEALFMDKENIWLVINSLVKSGLVKKTKNIYSFNESNFLQWCKEPIDVTLENFYSSNGGNEVLRFIQKISKYQIDPSEWVDMSVISNTSFEYDRARQLGLIQVHNHESKTFVQLKPESWFLTKKEFHPLWNQEAILVSAAFEVFVPYHYEPFVLIELLPFCVLKDSHYFLVFDMELEINKNNQKAASDFYHTIIEKSVSVPDIVKYDLKNLIS